MIFSSLRNIFVDDRTRLGFVELWKTRLLFDAPNRPLDAAKLS
jgi:hypothetical protein